VRYSQDQLNRFAKALRAWRGDRNLTQAEAAEELGVPTRTFQNWELGNAAPQASGLAKLRAAGAPIAFNDDGGLADFEERVLGDLAELRRLLGERRDSG
jgi:transcriptional regulator with XRE-family HTH domain